jgi:hypothetical protein
VTANCDSIWTSLSCTITAPSAALEVEEIAGRMI